jgi:ketosteroid isomerase-like protein
MMNTARVMALYAAYARGDVPAILDALAPGITWTVPGPHVLPTCGIRRGRNQVARYFETIRQTLAMEEFSPLHFITHGDRVIVMGYERARALATGGVSESEWLHVFTFRDGQITDFRAYTDTALMMEAYELVKPSVAA